MFDSIMHIIWILNIPGTKKIREISIKNQREKSRDLPCCDVMDMIVQ